MRPSPTLAIVLSIGCSLFFTLHSVAAEPVTDATPLSQATGERLAIQIIKAPGNPEPYAKGLRWGPFQDGQKQKPSTVDAPWSKDLGLIPPACSILRESKDPRNPLAVPPLEPWPSPQTAVSAILPDGFHLDLDTPQIRTSVVCTGAKTIGDVRAALRGILAVVDSVPAPTAQKALDAAKKGILLPYDVRSVLNPKAPVPEGRPVTTRGRKPLPPATSPADPSSKSAGQSTGAR